MFTQNRQTKLEEKKEDKLLIKEGIDEKDVIIRALQDEILENENLKKSIEQLDRDKDEAEQFKFMTSLIFMKFSDDDVFVSENEYHQYLQNLDNIVQKYGLTTNDDQIDIENLKARLEREYNSQKISKSPRVA